MAQIQAPYTFVTGDQVTAANLNAHTNSAILLPGSITDQPDIAANTVAANDSVALHDLSASTLKEATVGDLLNSGLNITTGAIAGKTGVDLVITPAAGQKVDVAGNLESNDFNAVGNVTIGGNLTITGSFSGAINSSGSFTNSGTANFTGTLQVNGSTAYVLTQVVEETVLPTTAASVANTYVVLFTSASYTKPSNEIWHIEIVGALQYNNYGYIAYKLKRTSGAVDLIGSFDVDHGTTAYDRMAPLSLSAIENTGTSFTSTYTFEMSFHLTGYTLGVGQTTNVNPSITSTIPATKFRIYKYTTA